jgi:hypothetical protein
MKLLISFEYEGKIREILQLGTQFRVQDIDPENKFNVEVVAVGDAITGEIEFSTDFDKYRYDVDRLIWEQEIERLGRV